MIKKQSVVYTVYRPQKEIKAVIEIVHGMMEHRKRYDYFAKALCNAGFLVITYDQRGHGETALSEEDLGFFAKERGWKLLIDDCYDICQLIKKEAADVPFILFGHSMGSIVAHSFIKRYDKEVDGVILSGAPNYSSLIPLGFSMAKMICKVKGDRQRSDLLKEMVVGQFNKKIPNAKTSSDWLSKNEENIENYLKDPLCNFNFTNAGYVDLLFGMKDMHDTLRWNLQNPELPILFIAGQNDPCTGYEKGLNNSVKVLKEAGYQKVERIVYGSLRHEILQEKERDTIISDLIHWIEVEILEKKG